MGYWERVFCEGRGLPLSVLWSNEESGEQILPGAQDPLPLLGWAPTLLCPEPAGPAAPFGRVLVWLPAWGPQQDLA